MQTFTSEKGHTCSLDSLYKGTPADDNLPFLVSTLGTLEWGFHQGISTLPSTTQKSMPSFLILSKTEQTANVDNQLPRRDPSLAPGRAAGQTHPGVTLKESVKALG